jgi:cytidylate kinase
MAQILILEGPHKSGKSTLAKILQDLYGYSYFKDMSYYNIKNLSMEKQTEVFNKIIFNVTAFVTSLPDDCKIILDRHHITDAACGKLYRDVPLNNSNFSYIDRSLCKHNVKLIMMVDEINALNERNEKDVSQELAMFYAAAGNSNLEKKFCNLQDLDEILKFIGVEQNEK